MEDLLQCLQVCRVESNRDADSNPLFRQRITQDELEDELEPWVDYVVRATHKADDLLAADGSRHGSSDRAERFGSKPA